MRFALACRLVLAVCLAIPNVWVHVVVGDDGGVETMDPEEMEALAEYMRELEAEEAAQQAEEADAEHDASRAASAEAAAKLAENKAAQEEAAAAAAEAARASQRSKSTFYRATAGAGAMKDRLSSRESVETSGSGGRSRVPRSSQPGNANSNGSGMGFGGAGGSASGSDAPSFASLNEQMRSGGPGGGASRAGHGDGAGRAGGGEEAEEEVEPESRRAARAALDEPTRAAHRRAVASVLRAAGDGSSMLGDAGGGDWYKVLGLRRSVKGRAKVKQEYRQRALTVHPDKNLDADAPAAFAVSYLSRAVFMCACA